MARSHPVYVLGLLLDTPWHLNERAPAEPLAELAQGGQANRAPWLPDRVGLEATVPAVPFAMFWNTPALSVAAEFFFYATFPWVCVSLTRRFRSNAALFAGFGGVIVLATALHALVHHGLNWRFTVQARTQYIVTVYSPWLRWSEFLAVRLAGPYFVRSGAAAAQAGSWLPGSNPGSVLGSVLGAVLGAVFGSTKARSLLVCACRAAVAARVRAPAYTGPGAAWWLLDVSTKYSGFIVPFTVPILAIASGRTWFSAALEHPWLVLLGEASHSLFMIHWPVISFLARGWLGLQGTPLVHAAFLLATVGVSVVCYRRVELPCRAWLRGMPIEGQRNLE